jgi:hypothetical protein
MNKNCVRDEDEKIVSEREREREKQSKHIVFFLLYPWLFQTKEEKIFFFLFYITSMAFVPERILI